MAADQRVPRHAASPYSPTISLAAGSLQGLQLEPQAIRAGALGARRRPFRADRRARAGRRRVAIVGHCTTDSPGPSQGSSGRRTVPDGRRSGGSVPRLLAYDPAGASLVLGAPLVFTFSDHQVPTSILQDPPKHLDWFYDPQQKHGSWLNVDRSDSLNLTVTDATTATMSRRPRPAATGRSGLVTTNVTAARGRGLGKIANAGGGLDVSVEVGGQYDKNQSSYNRGGSSNTLSTHRGDERRRPAHRDHTQLVGLPLPHPRPHAQGRQREPGARAGRPSPSTASTRSPCPGRPSPSGRAGAQLRGVVPARARERQRALLPPADSAPTGSSPRLDPSPARSDRSFWAAGGATGATRRVHPAPAPPQQGLHGRPHRLVGRAVRSPADTGSGNSTSTNGTLSESADIDAGALPRSSTAGRQAHACADVDVKFNNSNSWSSLKTSSNTTTSTNTFTLQQDSAAQPNWAYGAATAYYTDPAGAYRAAHAVNILASIRAGTGVAAVLRRTAGPGPQPPQPDGDDLQPEGQDQRHPQLERLRQPAADPGFLRPPPGRRARRAERVAASRAPISYPTDGDTVQLQVRVYNCSLDTAATNVPVEFGPSRATPTTRTTRDRPELGTRDRGQHPRPGLGAGQLPLGHRRARPPPGRSCTASSSSSPPTTRKNPNDPWNNVIHAWDDRYDDPATVDGTPSGDRLIDSFTGKHETLEAGQNKQGWGEVTINPKRPPGPGWRSRPRPPRRLASDGGPRRERTRVTAPHALAATAGRTRGDH